MALIAHLSVGVSDSTRTREHYGPDLAASGRESLPGIRKFNLVPVTIRERSRRALQQT